MKQHWNEVQPIDSYSVTMNGLLTNHDKKIIAFLYQPLIGPICTSLYTTFWHKVEENRLWSEEWNHYHLMNLLDLNLEDIYHARLKLEGIGLLKTYIKNEMDIRTFVYELQPPLSAEQFFTDGMLNIYLYQKLGQSHFLRLKKTFTDKKIETNEFTDVTRTFQDVFTSYGTGSLANNEGHEASHPNSGQDFFQRHAAGHIHIDGSDFDFDLLLSGLTDIMVPRKVFSPPVKEAIAKLSFLYSINAIEMKNIVLASLTADHGIDIDELRKAARDWYQMENNDRLPQLVDRHQPMVHREIDNKPTTKEEKLISYLETASPRQLLIDLSDGAEPAKSDLQAVEDIMFQQKLQPGVTNVLIHYVMLKTDMKLSKNYLEKIASHWSRKKINSVKSAMELAKNEHRQYQEWASGKKETNQRRKKPIRTEKLPDWFVSQEEPENQIKQENSAELEEKRRRLEAIQRKYQKNGGEKDGAN
ncbi:replication initiation and membrane attachment family protein [Lederbergia citrea]|uniref:replication initiation and membrane attachment family protein n=1 Tax=Lederbergia citrea TaxID=2833581 RepID=UPI001BC9718A|nr:replication initiation and membrane attachment family protein [Lederbergia citrea]MBS4176076.1 replication initiation and membrane attachment family protein [Lederbergia citrea]MBS4202637.1 replication initiation and membrane attachment family protein [Lederbergia citrea]